MAATKKPRRTYKPGPILVERIEVRCSVEEKDAIYAAALTAQTPVSRFLVESTMQRIKGKADE